MDNGSASYYQFLHEEACAANLDPTDYAPPQFCHTSPIDNVMDTAHESISTLDHRAQSPYLHHHQHHAPDSTGAFFDPLLISPSLSAAACNDNDVEDDLLSLISPALTPSPALHAQCQMEMLQQHQQSASPLNPFDKLSLRSPALHGQLNGSSVRSAPYRLPQASTALDMNKNIKFVPMFPPGQATSSSSSMTPGTLMNMQQNSISGDEMKMPDENDDKRESPAPHTDNKQAPTNPHQQRKSNHKLAEQRRRDSSKKCFEALASILPNITEKTPSKLHILQKCYEHLWHVHADKTALEQQVVLLKLELEKCKDHNQSHQNHMQQNQSHSQPNSCHHQK